MTSRENLLRTVEFRSPEWLAHAFPNPYGSDIVGAGPNPNPDANRSNGVDEWGAVWRNIGVCTHGEVEDYPLKEWSDFDKLNIPNIKDPNRWIGLEGIRERAGDAFIMGGGISLYQRVQHIRGLENTWADIYEYPDELRRLIDILADMSIEAIRRYAAAGVDGYHSWDDWGLQERLQISPDKWREIWKPAYARVYAAAHEHGMITSLHSCGYIVDILDDLIEIGLDIIQMDQQENMGLELLGERFRGRITFYCPVDIQAIMPRNNLDEIRAYCHKMVRMLSKPEGGFIARCYSDPAGAGHSPEAVSAMCEEFLKIKPGDLA